jgi:DNA-binding NarL/FixJ family response regulator
VDSPRKPRPSLGNTVTEAAGFGVIRIAVFDNNPLFRAGIVHVLNSEPGMEVVAQGGSGSDALRRAAQLSLDIVVLDSELIAADNELWRTIIGLRPAVEILVMAFSPDQEEVAATFAAGARGYIPKGVSPNELLETVRALYRHEGYLSPALGATMLANASLASRMKDGKANPLSQLTSREEEIFNLLAVGLKNKEIGRRLDVTEKSIKHYVTHIFEKLHVRNRVEAAMLLRPEPKPQLFQKESPGVVARFAVDVRREGHFPAAAIDGSAAKVNGESPPRGNGQIPSG